MASPTIDNTVAPVAGGAATSGAGTDIGDLVIVFTWERAGAGIPTHTLQSGFTEILSHGHNDGSTDGRLSVAFKVATSAGSVSYQAYTTSTGTPAWWTGLYILDAGTYSRGILAASVTATGTGAPNPPAVLNLDSTKDYLAIAISAWHLSASQTLTPTAPSGYTNMVHVSGAATGDVAASSLAIAAGVISIDPGAYADNQTPNGTCSITLAVPMASPTASNGPWTRKEKVQGLRTTGLTATAVYALDEIVVDDLVVVGVVDSSQDITGVTDSLGNTYTEYVAPINWGDSNRIALYYTVATVGGVRPLITVSFAAANDAGDHSSIGRYGGVDTTTPTRGNASASGSSTTWNSGDISSAPQTGDMLFGITGSGGNSEITGTGGTWVELGPSDASEFETSGEQLNVTGGTFAFSGTCDNNIWGAIAAAFRSAPTGQTISVDQVSETDTAQAVAWAPKRRLVGQVVETDTAQAMAINPIHRLVGQVVEIDTAQAITVRRTFPVNQVSEVDTAQAITWAPKNRLVARVFETDTAQAMTVRRTFPTGQVEEVDTAQEITVVTGGANIAVGQVEEIDTAQAITVRRTYTMGQVEEIDAAQAITAVQAHIVAVGQVEEVDVAQAVAWAPKHRLVEMVNETDTAFAITPVLGGGAIPSEVMVVIRGTVGAVEARVLIDDPTTTKVVINSPNKIAVVQDAAAAPVEVVI